MKKLLVLAFALLTVCPVRAAENWSIVMDGNIIKIDATQIDGKVYADVQSLLSALGYTASVNAEGKVIAIQSKAKAEVQVQAASLVSAPAPAVDSFDAILQGLKDIASAAKVGMSYDDYAKMVRESQISLDRFAGKFGEENPNTKSLRAALDIYLDANKLWKESNAKGVKGHGSREYYLPSKDEVVQPLLKKYPDLNKQLEKFFFSNILITNRGLNYLWDQAKTVVDKTKSTTP